MREESEAVKWVSSHRNPIPEIIVLLLAIAIPGASRAQTPYETQVGGFMTAVLSVLITGEFAGRSPSNAHASPNRPLYKPADYDDLRAAANDRAAFDAFRRRCKLVEGQQTTRISTARHIFHRAIAKG
jgi:hypothetical protein